MHLLLLQWIYGEREDSIPRSVKQLYIEWNRIGVTFPCVHFHQQSSPKTQKQCFPIATYRGNCWGSDDQNWFRGERQRWAFDSYWRFDWLLQWMHHLIRWVLLRNDSKQDYLDRNLWASLQQKSLPNKWLIKRDCRWVGSHNLEGTTEKS